MELEDSKRTLLRRTSQYKNQLEDEARLISERTEKILTNALIIGGALALSYLVVSQLSKTKKKSKHKAQRIELVSKPEKYVEAEPESESRLARIASEIGASLTSQATTFLLSIAKEKLMEYLQSKAEKKSPPNEHP